MLLSTPPMLTTASSPHMATAKLFSPMTPSAVSAYMSGTAAVLVAVVVAAVAVETVGAASRAAPLFVARLCSPGDEDEGDEAAEQLEASYEFARPAYAMPRMPQ
jgi:hypothetical protein